MFVVALVSGQSYDSEYKSNDGDEYHYDYSHPDYSKYYQVDTSAPLISSKAESDSSSGYTGPHEFSSFFNTPYFGEIKNIIISLLMSKGFLFLDLGSASNKHVTKQNIDGVHEPKKSATAFTTPQEFHSGFANYKADPFSKDYFEQAQKQLGDAAYETKPGPNYISYKIPPKSDSFHYKTQANYKSQSDSSKEAPEEYNKEEIDHEEIEDKEDYGGKSSEAEEEIDDKAPIQKPTYEFNIDHNAPLNYKLEETPSSLNIPLNLPDEGKLAALSATAPFSPQYYTKYTQQTENLSPYEKYSFQPVTDSYGLKTSFSNKIQSTAAPFNPTFSKIAQNSNYESQPSENIPKSLNLNTNACKRVNKHVSEKDIETGRFRRQAMNCFVCEDPKTGANFEQCSYSSEPKSDSYFIGKAQKYSKPVEPINVRFKRDTANEEKDEYVNPYDYIKSKSHDYYSKPEEFDSDFYKVKDFGPVEEYRFGPEFFSDQQLEKSSSEKISEELVKNAANCKQVKKESMTCMVCKDEKDGGSYEQCSYTSAPAEKKYAYVRERKFDKDDNPIEDKVSESSDPKEIAEGTETAEKHVPKKGYQSAESQAKNKNVKVPQSFRVPRPSSSEQVDDSYQVPKHFVNVASKSQKSGGQGLTPELYGSADSSETNEKQVKKNDKNDYPDLEEYHFKLFPQYNKQESKTQEKRVEVPDEYKNYEAEETQKDVEEVLAEFAKKDRSNCKKAYKKGMTCYLCVDKKGLEHEECMYISESQPKASHVAYHEVQKTNNPKTAAPADGTKSESQIQETEEPSKKKRFYKKVTTQSPIEIEAEASKIAPQPSTPAILPKKNLRKLKRSKNIPKDMQTAASTKSKVTIKKQKIVEPTLKTPAEFAVGPEEGAFSSETKPVYSKLFGTSLPKYMVEKSEYEKDFDKFTR